ncbi:latent-transforming growth factor beta-binding protein 2-like [Sycon ciliatum]|uniref:latent-transforming growth factor beta-binding protein 2-like n=1 Tax=Sycon ciliatum TaxID=27933 RepID=UPI0031F6A600
MVLDTCKGARVGCYHDGKRTKFFCECPSWKIFGGRDLGCQDVDICRHRYSTKCALFPTCTLLPGTLNYNCACLPVLTLSNNGSTCQQINECAMSTSLCAMNEICVETLASYYCTCKSGYYRGGGKCTNANECEVAGFTPCGTNEVCIDSPGSYTCQCSNGFSGSGRTCSDVNECSTTGSSAVTCPQNSTCGNTIGSYECRCDAGFQDILQPTSTTSPRCENIDECCNGQATCSADMLCNDTVGSYQCLCKTGFRWQGSGRTCSDVDECSTTSSSAVTCPQNSTCLNTIGSYECRCDAGFQDILQPTSPTSPCCENIDECPNGQADCSADMLCNDTVGSYECLCKTGFRWQGSGGTCSDVDECSPTSSSAATCPQNSTCLNTIGSYECRCDAGFQDILQPTSPTSPRCDNINECCNGQADCSADMLCNDTVGSYQCLCKIGFRWQGKDDVCENINECQTSAENPCTDTSQCIDTEGSFVCMPTWRGEALFSSPTSSTAGDGTATTTAAVQIATLAVGTVLLICAIANLLVASKVRKQQQCDERMRLENTKRGHEVHARLDNTLAESSTSIINTGSISARYCNSIRDGLSNTKSYKARFQDSSQQCGSVDDYTCSFHPNTGIPQGDEHNLHLETIMNYTGFDQSDYDHLGSENTCPSHRIPEETESLSDTAVESFHHLQC